MNDFATQLIELWDEYLTSTESVFQPTMTDFVFWLKDNRPNKMSNHTRTERYVCTEAGKIASPVTTLNSAQSKGLAKFEGSFAQQPRGDTFSKYEIGQAKEMYERGYTFPRIRQILKLDITLDRLRTIVTQP